MCVIYEIISSTKVKVIVDGGSIPQTVSCNPDVSFDVSDEVWVLFVNGNPRDQFVISKRSL
ncbi:hypothetical protein ACSVDA_24290 [Cytobacillus sp. Hm23]